MQMPIVVLLFCRSHCPRRRRCLKLPNEQPECRHIELFPLKEHLSSLDQCKVFVVETLQDTHLLIHGSSFWFTPCLRMSLQVREVPTTDCCRCQSVQIEVKKHNLVEAKSLHSSNTQICCEDLFFFCFQCNAADNFFFLHVFVTYKLD